MFTVSNQDAVSITPLFTPSVNGAVDKYHLGLTTDEHTFIW